MWLWPEVVARRWAVSMASRLRVVNFSAPNWLTAVLLQVRVPADGTDLADTTIVAVTLLNAPGVESVPLNFGDRQSFCDFVLSTARAP